MKYQMITTLENGGRGNIHAEGKDAICKKAFQGMDLTNCSGNDFAIKNGWRKSDQSSMFGESFTSFEVAYGFDYNHTLCLECQAVFNTPLNIGNCVVCDSDNVQIEKKHIRKPAIQENFSFQPDLFKQAVEDIKANPVQKEPSVDWQYLADTIGD
jgi:hypothetical protein